MKNVRYALAMLAIVMGSQLSIAASPLEGAVAHAYRINPVRQARNLGDTVQECLNNSVCKTAIKAVVIYFGGDPNNVEIASMIVGSRKAGEESWYSFLPPKNYAICKVFVRTISVVPASGPRGTYAGFRAFKDKFSIYTWTPRRGHFKGRSWYDGTVTIVAVPASSYDQHIKKGQCTVPATRKTSTVKRCRGKCGSYEF